MARSPIAVSAVLLSLFAFASASRINAAALHKQSEVAATPAPGGGDVSQAALKADEQDCKAAVLKCAGVNGGNFAAEKGEGSEGPAPHPSLLEEEAALDDAMAANASAEATEEEMLSVELATMRFNDFHCNSLEWESFQRKFGLPSGGNWAHTSFSSGDACQENNVVWLYPKHDHNGAFAINRNVCHRLMMWSQHACSVHVARVGSKAEAQAFLSRFPAESIMHLVVGGHGNGYALQWGEKSDGWLGLEKSGGRVPVGGVVQIIGSFRRLNKDRKMMQPGERGYVGNVDGDGDAMVYFDRSGMSFVSWREFGHGAAVRQVDSIMPTAFVAGISSKMQPHGSIFTDSCLSATGKYSPNLAGWVAKVVGKGVRVIGSEVSFGRVDVKRFQGGWHASLNTPEMRHAQRVFVNSAAKCPAWAKWSTPDSSGNCACRMFQRCKTRSGKPCPAAKGQESSAYFLPFCGESWAQDPCICSGSSGAVGAASPSLLLLLALGSLLAALTQV